MTGISTPRSNLCLLPSLHYSHPVAGCPRASNTAESLANGPFLPTALPSSQEAMVFHPLGELLQLPFGQFIKVYRSLLVFPFLRDQLALEDSTKGIRKSLHHVHVAIHRGDTSSKINKVDGSGLRDKVRSSDIQRELRVEVLLLLV